MARLRDVGLEVFCLFDDGDLQAVRLRLYVWRDRLPRALGAGDDGADEGIDAQSAGNAVVSDQ